MIEFIFFILFVLGLVLIPYRNIYNSINQLIDAKTVLKGLIMMAFPFIWMLFAPEMTDTPSAQPPGIARLSESMGSIAITICWLVAAAGLVMIAFSVWCAREHQEEIKKKTETPSTDV